MLSDEVLELGSRIFFGVLGLAIIYVVYRLISDALHQYHMGAVYDLEQKEKAVQKANRALSDAELVKQANEGKTIPDNEVRQKAKEWLSK